MIKHHVKIEKDDLDFEVYLRKITPKEFEKCLQNKSIFFDEDNQIFKINDEVVGYLSDPTK